MKQRGAKAAIAVAGVVAALVVPAATAAASTSKCPANALCVWSDDDYRGKRIVVKRTGVSNRVGNKMDDRASSVKNHWGKVGILYTERDGEGFSYCIEPGRKEADLTIPGFDDVTSSTRRLSMFEFCT